MLGLSASDKTKTLIRQDVEVALLEKADVNPNEMSEVAFNLLYDNIERMGVTDPILVRKHPSIDGHYRIVGGHHRVEVAILLGMDTVPCTIITDPAFDDDLEKFQVVRHNIIRGKMSPQKFMKLYTTLEGKYSDDIASEMFGFSSEEDFKKLVQATIRSLPPDMQDSFTEAVKEIRTIDGLASLLNRLFNDYGDTLPYGFMVFDFGGHDNVWLRMAKKQKEDFKSLASYCKKTNKSVDQVMTVILQLIAQNNLSQEALDLKVLDLPNVEKLYEVDNSVDYSKIV